jgi:hypothetical protein
LSISEVDCNWTELHNTIQAVRCYKGLSHVDPWGQSIRGYPKGKGATRKRAARKAKGEATPKNLAGISRQPMNKSLSHCGRHQRGLMALGFHGLTRNLEHKRTEIFGLAKPRHTGKPMGFGHAALRGNGL